MEGRINSIATQVEELLSRTETTNLSMRGNHEVVMDWITTLFGYLKIPSPPDVPGPRTEGPSGSKPKKDKEPERPNSRSSHAWSLGDGVKPEGEERPIIPVSRSQAPEIPTAPRKKAKTAIPSKYDGKKKGVEAKRFWTRCKAYLTMHTEEFDTEEEEMVWVLLLTDGLAADWAEPHLEAINAQRSTTETAGIEALGRSFLRYFGDPNEEQTASEDIAKCRQTEDAMEYTTRFETLRSRMPSWGTNEAPFIHMYKQGLKDDLRVLLAQQARQPRTLRDTQEWVIRMDKQITAAAPSKAKSNTSTSTTTVKVTLSVPNTRVTRSQDNKMVSKDDQAKRMSAGLCLKCRKKGHAGRN